MIKIKLFIEVFSSPFKLKTKKKNQTRKTDQNITLKSNVKL